MARTADARRLKDEAARAMERGKYRKALQAYTQLERLEPRDPSWARRAGEMHRNLGERDLAVAAWTRAADRYAQAGFLVKAIAVCRMILRLDPEHTKTQERLSDLNREQGLSLSRPRRFPIEEEAAGEGFGEGPGQGSGITVIPIEGVEEEPGGAVGAALARTPLFSDLPAQSLEKLIGQVRLVELQPGELLFRQGERGDALYVVSSGELAVLSEGPPRQELARLGDGEFAGEIALVTDEPRSATLEAVRRTELLRIDRSVVKDLLAERPEVLTVVLGFLRDRLVETLVATHPLFEPFAGDDRRRLAERFRFLEVEAGADLVTQGGQSDGLFLLLSGRAEVLREDGGRVRALAELGRGDLFGEISLLTREPANATVRSSGKSLVLELPGSDFREVIMTHPQILASVGDLAEERRSVLEEVLSGNAVYDEGHLTLP